MGAQVRDQVRNQVWDQVWDQVGDQVGAQVRNQVWDQVGAQVGAQVRDQVRDQVRTQVWDQARDQVRNQVRTQVYRAGYGLQDSGWLSFYSFFREACVLDSTKKLAGLFALAETCGWWWLFEHIAILTEIPIYMERDDRGRLHSAHRMAIEYSDGWGLYRWHGINVPKELITDAGWTTPERIAEEQNQEVRRAMIERIGWDAYLAQAGAVEIQRDERGILLDLPEHGQNKRSRFVRVVDPSTGRQYALCVPVNTLTAHEGVAWGFGLNAEEYVPYQET